MSVFWEEGQDLKILSSFTKTRKRYSKSFNYFIEPDPDQLLRVSIGTGFRRARLKYAYALLRGKDLETGKLSQEQREEQFEVLQKAQQKTLDLQNWHDFLSIIQLAGFRSSSMITSKTALIYTYVIYLIGKYDYKLSHKDLEKAISKWFFMSALTSRYEFPESAMERDLANFRSVKSKDDFIDLISETILSIDK